MGGEVSPLIIVRLFFMVCLFTIRIYRKQKKKTVIRSQKEKENLHKIYKID